MNSKASPFEPVTYNVPIERIQRLSRGGSRKLYPRQVAIYWVWIIAFVAFFLANAIWAGVIESRIAELGWPLGLSSDLTNFLVPIVGLFVFFTGLIMLKRRFRASHSERFEFNSDIALAPVEGGIRISGKDLEYRIRGAGIYQLLRERDGVVVVVAGLMFLVPDAAFSNAEHRVSFIDYLASLMSGEARERSAEVIDHVRQS